MGQERPGLQGSHVENNEIEMVNILEHLRSTAGTHPHSPVPQTNQLDSDLSLHEDANNGESSDEILFFPTISTEL